MTNIVDGKPTRQSPKNKQFDNSMWNNSRHHYGALHVWLYVQYYTIDTLVYHF